MDIMRGSLDDIYRPAAASPSRSRSGNRLFRSFQVDKQKVSASPVFSLEVLTPEPGISQWDLTVTSDEDQEAFPDLSSEDGVSEKTSQGYTGSRAEVSRERTPDTVTTSPPEDPGSTGPSQSTEDQIDPKLEKAIKKMKALDKILLKKMAKEKEVKAQGLKIRKQLWEELQLVSHQSSPRSHEESLNTNKFLALTPQVNDPEADAIIFEKMFPPLFSTQLPLDDYDEDMEVSQGDASGIETGELLSGSERSHHRKEHRKRQEQKRVNFIHRNIELVQDAGSHVPLTKDEKLRLEQLLEDVGDGHSDDDIMAGVSLRPVPGEGYTPEPADLEKLAEIEAELQRLHSSAHPAVTDDQEIVCREARQEWSAVEFGNLETEPGENVLRYTKELRKQKTRLKDIDKCLEDLRPSISPPGSVAAQ